MAGKTAKQRSEHKRGLVRVIGFFTVVGVVCAGFSLRTAKAEVENRTVIIGRQMTALADSAEKSGKTEVSKIVLNGQPLFMASTTTDDDVPAVLARYHKYCEDNRAHATDVWKQLAEVNAKEHKVDESSPGAKMAESGGTLRGGDNNEGTVLCFVKAPDAKPTLKEGLQALAETGELGAVGMVRYAYAKKTSRGKTHVLSAWTTEKFSVKEFAPEGDRDVPGYDFAKIPRPEESVRLFSIHMEGAPYGVNVYQSKAQTPQQTIEMFDRKLVGEGWFSLDIESKPKRETEALKGAVGRLYEKDGAVLTVVSKVSEGQTLTSLGMAGLTEHEPAPGDRQSRR